MSQSQTVEYLNKTLPGAIVSSHHAYGHDVILIHAKFLHEVANILKKELNVQTLLDVSALDWSKWPAEANAQTASGVSQPHPSSGTSQGRRFEVDYFFLNMNSNERIQLKVAIENDSNPRLHSIADIYPSANWSERECFDMMGIHFDGHPNLKRLLMWNEFIGHPLRKDYPLNRRQPVPISEEIV